MNISDYAARVRRLRQDETLMMVFADIKEDAVQVFSNPNSTPEKILEAHSSIQAIGTLERKFDSIEGDARIKEQ
jgi:hypothetical protein